MVDFSKEQYTFYRQIDKSKTLGLVKSFLEANPQYKDDFDKNKNRLAVEFYNYYNIRVLSIVSDLNRKGEVIEVTQRIINTLPTEMRDYVNNVLGPLLKQSVSSIREKKGNWGQFLEYVNDIDNLNCFTSPAILGYEINWLDFFNHLNKPTTQYEFNKKSKYLFDAANCDIQSHKNRDDISYVLF